MAPGNVVVLNGPSSSGKSSIAKALQEVMEEPYFHTGIDYVLTAFPQWFFVPSDGVDRDTAEGFLLVFEGGSARQVVMPEGEVAYVGSALAEVRIGPAGLRLLTGMYRAVAALAEAGNHVVVDDVIYDRRVLRAAAEALHRVGALFVGVRCQREVAQRRERERGDRAPGGAAAFYDLVHRDSVYDLELDTSVLTPAECAARVREYILGGHPREAFRRLDRMFAEERSRSARLPRPGRRLGRG